MAVQKYSHATAFGGTRCFESVTSSSDIEPSWQAGRHSNPSHYLRHRPTSWHARRSVLAVVFVFAFAFESLRRIAHMMLREIFLMLFFSPLGSHADRLRATQ